MPTGKVEFFHDRKGYGFIKSEEMSEDVFFHVDDIDGPEPREGQELEFDVEQAPRGPRARNVRYV
ncbi:MAG: cold shock domain-containing protein [Candidatus Thermoplasmatota archaeon]|nr:cold shock domain-containing protein [Candidatus Thermoplasmatota archaeon]